MSYASGTAKDANGNESTYTVGSQLSLNSSHSGFHEKDKDLSHTYEYVIQVNQLAGSSAPQNAAGSSQLLQNSFGRFRLYYRTEDNTVYPQVDTFLYANQYENGSIKVSSSAYTSASNTA